MVGTTCYLFTNSSKIVRPTRKVAISTQEQAALLHETPYPHRGCGPPSPIGSKKKEPLRQNLWVGNRALSSPNGMIVLSINDQPGGTQCLSKQY